MNIRDFLIDNYIYIIIVIVLTIITIIGFLADKKKNGDKKVKTMSGTIPNTSNQNQNINPGMMNLGEQINSNQPMNYQPMGGIPNNDLNSIGGQSVNQMPNTIPVSNNMAPTQMPINQNIPVAPEPVPNQMNQNINMPGIVQNGMIDNNLNIPTNPQPIEPISQNMGVSPEPMYQPLSEQQTIISPVEPIQNINSQIPTEVNSMMNMNQAPVGVPNMMPSMQAPMSQVMPSNNVVPTPMPMNPGMPVTPEPIPNQVGSAMATPVDNNNVPNPANPQQPPVQGPINFVYGPQQSNQNNGGFMQ